MRSLDRAKQLKRDPDRVHDTIAAYKMCIDQINESSGHERSLATGRVSLALADFAAETGRWEIAAVNYNNARICFEVNVHNSNSSSEGLMLQEAKKGVANACFMKTQMPEYQADGANHSSLTDICYLGLRIQHTAIAEEPTGRSLLPMLSSLATFAVNVGRQDLARTAYKRNIEVKKSLGLQPGSIGGMLKTLEAELAEKESTEEGKQQLRHSWERIDQVIEEMNAREQEEINEMKDWGAICRLAKAHRSSLESRAGESVPATLLRLCEAGQAALKAKQAADARKFFEEGCEIIARESALWEQQQTVEAAQEGKPAPPPTLTKDTPMEKQIPAGPGR